MHLNDTAKLLSNQLLKIFVIEDVGSSAHDGVAHLRPAILTSRKNAGAEEYDRFLLSALVHDLIDTALGTSSSGA